MGSMIHLALGNLEVDWGKNSGFVNYSQLYQPSDLMNVPYHYVTMEGEPIVEYQEGYSRPLGAMVERLELLGYTLPYIKQEFEALTDLHEIRGSSLTFEEFADAMREVDVSKVSREYGDDYGPGDFVRREILERIGITDEWPKSRHHWDLSLLLENVSGLSGLRLLAENPRNLNLPVIWTFHDVVYGGWVTRELVTQGLRPQDKYLVVTEGSSDALILQKALALLKPEVADFFKFIDMHEGYPFTGIGNLFKFCQGLVSIGILNKVVVLYDNDAEGMSKFEATRKLALPVNMAVIRLPDNKELESINTLGPNGEAREDINGRAAAIECFLDFQYQAESAPRVRWKNYVDAVNRYQGSLENKKLYCKNFLSLQTVEPNYDFRKILSVLNVLTSAVKTMAQELNLSELAEEA